MDPKKDAQHLEDVPLDDVTVVHSLRRKWDYRLLPWLFAAFFCSFMDRSAIGNASIAGLNDDLGLEGRSYNIALALFYVVYIIVDVPAVWIYQVTRKGNFLAILIVCWGITTICIGFVRTAPQLYAVRCLLGFFEGGLSPCLFLYLALYYKSSELQFRMAWFYISAPISNAVGGLLASGLGQITSGRYQGWPFIFFVEGAITVIVGILCFWTLPNNPPEASYLTEEERECARRRLIENTNVRNEDDEHIPFKFKEALRGLLDWNTILISLGCIGVYSNLYAYTLFSPTIIYGFGFTVVESQLLSVPPYVVAAIAVLVVGFFADRLGMRGPWIIGGACLQIIGWILQLTLSSIGPRYFGLFLIAIGCFSSVPSTTTWLVNNIQPAVARSTALGTVVAVGNMGGIIATFSYIGDETSTTGNALQLGMSGLTVICCSLLMFINRQENARRAKGGRDSRLTDGKIPVTELGSRHPDFKLSL